MNSYILRNDQIKAAMITAVAMLPVGGDVVLEVVIREYKAKRSTAQNDLYWEWMTIMAAYFSRPPRAFSKDDFHDLMRHKFLPLENKTVGNTPMPAKLTSTTALGVSRMYNFMMQIDVWSAEQGCYLPRPEDSDYQKYRDAAQ